MLSQQKDNNTDLRHLQELLRSRQHCIQIESDLEQLHQSHWALLDEYGRLQDDFRSLLRSFKTGSATQTQV